MRLVHPHLSELMIERVKNGDILRLLDDLHSTIYRNEGHSFGPTLVAWGRIALAGHRNLAQLLHDLRRPRLQDRIAIIADQLAAIAHSGSRSCLHARPVPHRAGTR